MDETSSSTSRRVPRPRSQSRSKRPAVALPTLAVPKIAAPKIAAPKIAAPKRTRPKRTASGAASVAAAAAKAAAPKSRAARRKKHHPLVTLFRIAFVPVRLAAFVLGVGTKVGYRAGRMSAKGGKAVARRAGWKNVALLGIGFVLGLLASSVPGRSMRVALRKAITGSGGETSGGGLADAVINELAHSPRTWHLTQPQVTAVGGVVTLSGSVAHETARDALERTARGVSGVTDVVSNLTVT
jgi:hypothetical protein